MRVVSLVPSVTETLLAWDVTPIAVTRFCEHPELPHVGGTKDPDIEQIATMAPDLVVVNDEENRREDFDALEARGLRVHVVRVESTPCARRAWQMQALALLVERTYEPEPLPSPVSIQTRAFIPIWRRPWMTMNGDTYGSSVLAHLGVANVFDSTRRALSEVTLGAVPEVRRRARAVRSPTRSARVTPTSSARSRRSRSSTARTSSGGACARRVRSSGWDCCSLLGDCRSADRTHDPARVAHRPTFGQGDDAATEARPGQAGTEHSVQRPQVVDATVECRRRHLVVVAQARVAVVHHAPGIANARPRIALGEPIHSLVLGDHVTGARAHVRVGDLPDRLDLRVAQRADELLRLSARSAPGPRTPTWQESVLARSRPRRSRCPRAEVSE